MANPWCHVIFVFLTKETGEAGWTVTVVGAATGGTYGKAMSAVHANQVGDTITIVFTAFTVAIRSIA